MRDPWLKIDVIDLKLDAMLDAARLDDRDPDRGIAVGLLAVEHIAHGNNGLERVAWARRRLHGY